MYFDSARTRVAVAPEDLSAMRHYYPVATSQLCWFSHATHCLVERPDLLACPLMKGKVKMKALVNCAREILVLSISQSSVMKAASESVKWVWDPCSVR